MPAFTENAKTTFLVDKNRLLPIGANPFEFGVYNANRTSIQWIVHQPVVGASAAISLFVAASNREREDLVLNLDPATNPYWSPLESLAGVPLTFPHQPGAVIGSCLLPIGLLSLTSMLAVVTVAGAPYPLGSFSLLVRTTG